MKRLTADVARRVEELSHVRAEEIGFSISHARVEGLHGQFAKIVPMRFEGGSDVRVYKRRRYRMPPVAVAGKPILYAIYFCMPKFQNLPFEEKLLTVLHELYHISPEFNGDIRRFPGKNYAHGPSRKAYNEKVKTLVDAYLASEPDPETFAFLAPNAEELFEQYGKVTAPRIPMPRLIPVDPPKKRK
jgi:predicted metallopeptidase